MEHDDDMPKTISCGSETRGNICLTHVLWCPTSMHGRSEQPETGIRRLDIPRDQHGHFELMQHGCRDWPFVTDVTFRALERGWSADRICTFISKSNETRRRRMKSEIMAQHSDTRPALVRGEAI